jgi:hypothetical protein
VKYTELVYGSTALCHWFPDFDRVPSDIDIMTYVPKTMYNKGILLTHYSESCRNPNIELYYIDAFNYILNNNKHSYYVDADFLYTIKVSHAEFDVRWEKTMHDIQFLKEKGCVLNKELHKLLLHDWNMIHREKRVNLNKNNDDFFTKYVTRIYEHDWLHEHFAFYSRPLHESIREDLAVAKCLELLWDKLSYDDKLKCTLEEVYVIATERFYLNGIPPRTAKSKALKLLITSMTKGWFCLFLIENFKELLRFSDVHYQYKIKSLEKYNEKVN